MNLTAYLTDSFARGTTTAGAAGSTSGVGNGWIDRAGGVWALSGGQLAKFNSGGSLYLTNWLVRPVSEAALSQRAAWTFLPDSVHYVPIVLLRVNSAAGVAYAAYYDYTGAITLSAFGSSNVVLGTAAFTIPSGAHSLVLDFQVTPNATAGTDLRATVYDATAPGVALGTAMVSGDTTAGLQSAGTYGVTGSADFPGASAVTLYTGASATLTVTPTSATVSGAGATQTLTAALSGSTASLAASVSGGGTLSTAAPTSGTAFTYTAPGTGSGSATITVTDTTDGLSATATVAYSVASGPVATVACVPTSFPLGVATPFVLTGSNTAWTGSTRPTVSGGSGAFVSNVVASGQTLSGTLNPGQAAAALTLGDSADAATVVVSAVANVVNNVVWHGDSLTYGQNGSGAGGTGATRIATVLSAMGPMWRGSNQGVAGQTLTQMAAQLGSVVNGLYDASKVSNLLIVQGGHNDIGQGASAATVIARIETYVATALAAHPWRIVWCTELPAAYPGVYPATFDTVRDAVNAWMRLNWQSIGIGVLADVALDARMGLDGCEYNGTYFSGSDFTHPTDAGYAIWGSYDLAAMALLSGGLPRRWTH